MTQEQKAEAYSKAVEKAKLEYNTTTSEDRKQWLEELFPELKESKDELTWLTRYIEEEAYSLSMDIRDNEDRIKLEKLKKSLAWLEKQGEEKKSYDTCYSSMMDNKKSPYGEKRDFGYFEENPADKIEPKFHDGDWVIDKQGIVHQIANVVENVTNHTYGYDIVGGGYFNDNNEGVRLWTIQDAKDGDVLVSVNNKGPFIYKGCLDPKHPDSPVAYCGIDTEGCFCACSVKFNYWWTDEEVQPATKEQRDLLFQKMKEAEYEFDFDKKELKKIEDESENFKRQVMSEMNDLIKDYVQQKSAAWSEEDEKRVESLHGWLDTLVNYIHHDAIVSLDLRRERMQQVERLKTWLKSLKERYTWKPSDEQIYWIKWVAHRLPDTEKANEAESVLEELLEQLKKLKGE